MALIGEMKKLTIGDKTYTIGGGTITSVGISNASNGGLTITGSPITSSGTISIGHTNILNSAQTTEGLYPITIDRNGHISSYGTVVNIYDWAKASTKPSYNFSEIDSKPNSLNGYGITNAYTKTEVDNLLAGLPEPMIFKGSLGSGGTIASLPSATADNEGFTYKVITAGTYASQAAKVGDTFISDGSAWVLIPSGDEPGGTVTSVGIANATNGGLSISSSPITTSGTITIGHSNVLSSAQTTQGVYPIKIDKNGHISAYGSVVTIPSITLNNSSTTEPSFYAPTTAGSSGQYLKSNGSGQAPTWASITLPTNIVTGTGTSGQIAVWTDTSTIGSGPKITASTSAPTSSNGSNGDFWFTYTE